MSQVHIADIDFADFYGPAVQPLGLEADIVLQIEALPRSSNPPKIILHQAARMIWLADQIDVVAAGRPAFQVLFYVITAELVAKIANGFQGEGESKKYVRKFFSEICIDSHRQRLSSAFSNLGGKCLTLIEAVDLLYRVRCDVVHEGQYYLFNLRRDGGTVDMLVDHSGLQTNISQFELRKIVLEGSLMGACRLAKLS